MKISPEQPFNTHFLTNFGDFFVLLDLNSGQVTRLLTETARIAYSLLE